MNNILKIQWSFINEIDKNLFNSDHLKKYEMDFFMSELFESKIEFKNDKELLFFGNIFNFVRGFEGALIYIHSGMVPNSIKGLGVWDVNGGYNLSIKKEREKYIITEINENIEFYDNYYNLISSIEKIKNEIKSNLFNDNSSFEENKFLNAFFQNHDKPKLPLKTPFR